MARLARVVVPGLPHHVTQRGNRRMDTFFGGADYRAYLALLSKACERTGVACWAYCLMPNHVHLILVPPEGAQGADGLRACLGDTHRRYTRAINAREGWRGHLWQERFHSFVMDEAHLLACARYVEQNPVKAGLVRRARDWLWSSARAHLAGCDDGLCAVAPLLSRVQRHFDMPWRRFLAAKTTEQELEALRRHAGSGRPLGDESFLDHIERLTGRSLKPKPRGRPRKTETGAKRKAFAGVGQS